MEIGTVAGLEAQKSKKEKCIMEKQKSKFYYIYVLFCSLSVMLLNAATALILCGTPIYLVMIAIEEPINNLQCYEIVRELISGLILFAMLMSLGLFYSIISEPILCNTLDYLCGADPEPKQEQDM
jgi:hypothetical protein